MKKDVIIETIQKMAEKESFPFEILQTHPSWFENLKEEGNSSDLIYTCFESHDPESAESENNLTIAISLSKGRAARYRTAVADDDFQLLEVYPKFKTESELIDLLTRKSRAFLERAESNNDDDEEEDSSGYQVVHCPVCNACLCDEEGSTGECPHLLMAWNTDFGCKFIKNEIKDLIEEQEDLHEIEEEPKYSEIKQRVGCDIELIESSTGLNTALTSVGTIYILVKLE
jgi:hypothetical protein